MRIGLRIDVDTFRGTRLGVPALVRLLAAHDIRGTFFFSVGPDNMGRHLWRLARPRFLRKMLRSDAAGLYGWDILLRGTLWPGPVIGERLSNEIRSVAEAGHEVGFHAWDHHAWQSRVDRLTLDDVRAVTDKATRSLSRITGAFPTSSAAPGWKCNDLVLRAQSTFPFAYQSDCRGESIFLPLVDGQPMSRPQIPVTLPTYDELVGRDGVTDANYNQRLLERLAPAGLNVLTIHAEVEGVSRAVLFEEFLAAAAGQGASFVPLGQLLPAAAELPVAPLVSARLEGREGTVAVQGASVGTRAWTGAPREATPLAPVS